MIRKFIIGAVGIFLLSVTGTASASFIVSDPGDSSVANGIRDLDIGGVFYDVDFTQSRGIFDLVFGAGDPPSGIVPTFYYDQAAAEAAATAIANAFIANGTFDMVGVASLQAWEVQVPYRYGGNPLNIIDNASWYINTSTAALHSDIFNRSSTPPSYAGWATFTRVAVPEPGTLALFGLGLLGMGLARRKRA